jgi:hypothetical protein
MMDEMEAHPPKKLTLLLMRLEKYMMQKVENVLL